MYTSGRKFLFLAPEVPVLRVRKKPLPQLLLTSEKVQAFPCPSCTVLCLWSDEGSDVWLAVIKALTRVITALIRHRQLGPSHTLGEGGAIHLASRQPNNIPNIPNWIWNYKHLLLSSKCKLVKIGAQPHILPHVNLDTGLFPQTSQFGFRNINICFLHQNANLVFLEWTSASLVDKDRQGQFSIQFN